MQENKTMTIYAAKCRGNATNCLYSSKVNLTDEETARKAFSRDTVFAEYKDNYRANDNFIRSNVIPFDCDNDHSNEPSEWITDTAVTAFVLTVSADPARRFCTRHLRCSLPYNPRCLTV